jgi:hypothetical protein
MADPKKPKRDITKPTKPRPPPKGVGRPKKYLPEYCDQIIDFMAEGKSLLQFAASINCTRDTVYEWAKQYKEFSDALNEAKEKCESYWERIVQAKTVKKIPGSDALLLFYLKNRFKWTERAESKIEQSQSITFTTQIGEDGAINRQEEAE